MRVPEEKLNRRGHCPQCGRIVTVTLDNTLPSNKARPAKIERHTPKPEPAHPELATPEPYPPKPQKAPSADASREQCSEEASTPDAESVRPPGAPAPLPSAQPSEEVSPPGAEPAFEKKKPRKEAFLTPITPLPPPESSNLTFPPRGAKRFRENSLELLLNAIAAAMDIRKWLFALAILLIWLAGGGVLLFTAYIHWMLTLVLGILWGALCWGAGIGYLSRLIHVRLNEKRAISFSHSERFLSRRFFDLILSLVAPCIPLAAIGIFLNGVLFLMSQTPEPGGVFSGVFLFPAFIINGALLLMAVTSALVPCIIAVEDVDLKNALNRLSGLILNRPGALYAALGSSLGMAACLMAGLGGIATLAILGTLKAANLLIFGPGALSDSYARIQNEWNPRTALACFAVALILTFLFTIIITLFTACLTFSYRWVSRKT